MGLCLAKAQLADVLCHNGKQKISYRTIHSGPLVWLQKACVSQKVLIMLPAPGDCAADFVRRRSPDGD